MILLLSLFLSIVSAFTTPCPTEDSHGCYYDSDNGFSFYALPNPFHPHDNDAAIRIPKP